MLVALFILLPMMMVVIASFYDGNVFDLPYAFTTEWYQKVFSQGGAITAYANTLRIAIPVMILSTIIGTAGAIGFTRYNFRYQKIIQTIALLPIFFPLVIIGLAMSLWFRTLNFQMGFLTAIIGETVWISPIVMFVVSIQALKIAPNIEDAARDLGAGTVAMYRDITLPLIWDGVVSGAIFAFILSFNNYYIAANLTGANSTITTWLHSRIGFGFTPLVPAAASLSFYITLVFLLAALILEFK